MPRVVGSSAAQPPGRDVDLGLGCDQGRASRNPVGNRPRIEIREYMAAIWEERQRLVRLCTTITGDRDAAEDLAQETLLEAWRNQHKLTDSEGAGAWLTAVARNVCLRWTTRRRDDVPVAEVPEQAVELEFELEREDLAELLDGALELLPAASREVLVQR